jgi:biotin operon repressor/ribosomal protein L44E
MTKLKRTTHKAKNFSKEEVQGYCLLPASYSAIAITNRLTGSQFRLWHYLMMIDSFADRNRDGEMIFRDIPSPSEIAEAIGSNPRTVEKDMNRLQELGLYVKRVTSWEGYNSTAEEGRRVADQMKQNGRTSTSKPLQDKDGYLTAQTAKQPDAALNNRNNGKITAQTVKQPEVALNNREQDPELLQRNDSDTPHTLHTYSDFKNSLTPEERASFLKFCEEETNNLSTKINDLEAWLAHKNAAGQNRWEVYYKKFTSSKKPKDSSTSEIVKKFQLEIEQQRQEAERAWEESQQKVDIDNEEHSVVGGVK